MSRMGPRSTPEKGQYLRVCSDHSNYRFLGGPGEPLTLRTLRLLLGADLLCCFVPAQHEFHAIPAKDELSKPEGCDSLLFVDLLANLDDEEWAKEVPSDHVMLLSKKELVSRWGEGRSDQIFPVDAVATELILGENYKYRRVYCVMAWFTDFYLNRNYKPTFFKSAFQNCLQSSRPYTLNHILDDESTSEVQFGKTRIVDNGFPDPIKYRREMCWCYYPKKKEACFEGFGRLDRLMDSAGEAVRFFGASLAADVRRLIGTRPFEYDDNDERLLRQIWRFVDVEEYIGRTPLVLSRVGTLKPASNSGSREIVWEDGEETVIVNQEQAHELFAWSEEAIFQADVSYHRVSGDLVKISNPVQIKRREISDDEVAAALKRLGQKECTPPQ